VTSFILEQSTGYSILLPASGATSTGNPQAFLKGVLLDDDRRMEIDVKSKRVSGAAAVWNAATASGGHEELTIEFANITQAGYLDISLNHDAAENIDIYFDDLTITHEHIALQENHYDPWGLNLAGIERQGQPDNKYQYNGKEKQEEFGLGWNDYGWRNYDSQLGRWHSVDPMTESQEFWTPYHYVYDNPIRHTDPDGRYPDGNGPGLPNGMSMIEDIYYSTLDGLRV
jgi:RHS repeat-associated protein